MPRFASPVFVMRLVIFHYQFLSNEASQASDNIEPEPTISQQSQQLVKGKEWMIATG